MIKADFTLDIKGEVCPYPSLMTLEALKSLSSGEVLEVLSDCTQALHNIPVDVKKAGGRVLKAQQLDNNIRFLIKKE